MFAFIYGEVKNVSFRYHNYNRRLYFDIINVTIKGYFHYDWFDYYYATYQLNDTYALHVNYFGINKLEVYLFSSTVKIL